MPISCAELCNRRFTALRATSFFLCSVLAACAGEHHCDPASASCDTLDAPGDAGSEDTGAESDAGDDPDSSADQETDASTVHDAGPSDGGAAETPLISAFKQVRVTMAGGLPVPDAGCLSRYTDKFSLEASSRLLSWDYCRYERSGSRVDQGSRVLDQQEYQAALNALSTVRLSASKICGADKPTVTLAVDTDDGQTWNYRDAFYACNEPDPDKPFATSLDRVHGVLESLARADPLPTQHDTIAMWFSKLGHETAAGGSTCGWQEPARYTFDVAARTLSWELCKPDSANVFRQVTGNRPLSEDEKTQLLAAFAQLKFGASKPCSEMALPDPFAAYPPSPTTIRSNAGDKIFYAYGEEATCSGDDFSSYGPIVTDVRELEKAVSALVR